MNKFVGLMIYSDTFCIYKHFEKNYEQSIRLTPLDCQTTETDGDCTMTKKMDLISSSISALTMLSQMTFNGELRSAFMISNTNYITHGTGLWRDSSDAVTSIAVYKIIVNKDDLVMENEELSSKLRKDFLDKNKYRLDEIRKKPNIIKDETLDMIIDSHFKETITNNQKYSIETVIAYTQKEDYAKKEFKEQLDMIKQLINSVSLFQEGLYNNEIKHEFYGLIIDSDKKLLCLEHIEKKTGIVYSLKPDNNGIITSKVLEITKKTLDENTNNLDLILSKIENNIRKSIKGY